MSARALLVAFVAAVLLALAGIGWEVVTFGWGDADTAGRLEAEVRRRVGAQAAAVQSLAVRAAANPALVEQAAENRAELPALFLALETVARSAPAGDPISTTIYVAAGPASEYPLLAWSDGPAADLGIERLKGPAALFVAPGSAGMHLVYVQPLEHAGRRVGAAAATVVLSPAIPGASATLATSYGPVTLIPKYFGAGDVPPEGTGFVIDAPSGAPLVEAHFNAADLAEARARLRRRTFAAAMVPLAVALISIVPRALERRRRASRLRGWLAWSFVAQAATMITALTFAVAASLAGAPDVVARTLVFAGCLGLVAIAGGVWWRRSGRLDPRRSRGQFTVEQLGAGIALALGVAATVQLLRWREGAASFDAWHSVLFPFDAVTLVELYGVLFAEIAILWLAATAVALVAVRWRPTRRPSHAVAAVLLWLAPAALLLSLPEATAGIPRVPAAALLFTGAAFGLAAPKLRRHYGRATQTARLGLGLLALVTPLVAAYPLASFVADETTRGAIETVYSPATARHPDELREGIARAQREIDALAGLAEQLRVLLPGDSRMAFSVWNQTSLSRTRVSSDVELYGADRRLVSRFSLNLSDYLYRTSRQTWSGSGCAWNVSGEVVRVGAADRPMLHAERGLCDAEGALVGGVVIHVAPTDYQALPFVSSPNPYYEVFGTPTSGAVARPRDLQLVVYGWSLRPLFVSNPELATWSIAGTIGDRLYQSVEPFWTTLGADDRTYNVYFSQTRSGIYALGYPQPTVFGHLTRMAEILALTAVLFVVVQIGAVLLAPFAHRRNIPLRTVIREVRTSFYRKLFLFFVFVAVGPVLLFAFAFGAYMTGKLRAGVEEEARNVVVVARRVFEEVASATSSASPGPVPATDDVMVWIRQVIGQDVNVFDGATLAATSQRDLFNSGLLQTRTPASVYRAVTLDRRPTFVTEDRLGVFTYLVAAAPVGQPGRETTLVVPLAPRQRAIEREIDDFYRGVLVGAVAVVVFAAALGASLAGRVADPVARLTRATRQIAAGRDDVRVATDTVDELRRLVDDFNVMAETLGRQRTELARTNQLKAWNEMARQVAHEIKNPLTPIQLAAEHLLRVHADQGRPLGSVFDQCLETILGQVRLLRQIASDFANFATEPSVRIETVDLAPVVRDVVNPYLSGLSGQVGFVIDLPDGLPPVSADRTLLARALTNVVENAVQAMPGGGTIRIAATSAPADVRLTIADSGVGMDAESVARAFEPYFSTKTGGSGLGLANARRNLERQGGSITLASTVGAGAVVTMTLARAEAHPDGRGTG